MEQFHSFAVAIAAANGHPDPHAYADSVVAQMENPPAKPAPEPEPSTETSTAETGTETPADPQ